MRKKLLGYSLVSFFSFWFFLGLFITGVYAQIPSIQPSIPPASSEFLQSSSVSVQTTDSAATNPQPTVYLVSPDDPPTVVIPPAQQARADDIIPQPTIYLIPLDSARVISPDLEVLFIKYSNLYQVDINELEKIARCESHFHAQSVNGIYVGMFQFDGATWEHARLEMGLDPNRDLRTNAEESLRTAAYWISAGHLRAWSCK